MLGAQLQPHGYRQPCESTRQPFLGTGRGWGAEARAHSPPRRLSLVRPERLRVESESGRRRRKRKRKRRQQWRLRWERRLRALPGLCGLGAGRPAVRAPRRQGRSCTRCRTGRAGPRASSGKGQSWPKTCALLAPLAVAPPRIRVHALLLPSG